MENLLSYSYISNVKRVITLLLLTTYSIVHSQTAFQLPYNESFESGIGDFTQDTTDEFDWTRWSNATPSNGTGPSAAADGTFYLFIEGSGNSNKTANLLLENISFDNTITTAHIQFQYHMRGEDIGSLKLQVQNADSTWKDLWSENGEQGNIWLNKGVDISNYIGNNPFSLRFSGTTGGGAFSDIAIDNVAIIEGTDATPPIITLVGDAHISLEIGGTYVEEGATAIDNFDGDITNLIVIAGDVVDTQTSGTYTVTYNVTDSAGNSALEVERVVEINPDTQPPVITLLGLEYVSQFSEPIESGFSKTLGGLLVPINPPESSNTTNQHITGFRDFVLPRIIPCSGLVTYSEAIELMNSIGARLPTLKELQANVTEGTGCGYDSKLIWTQSLGENEGERWVDYGSFSNSSPESRSETSTAYVSYVFDNSPLTPLPFELLLGDTYIDPGFTAEDNVDGDITSLVVTGGDPIDSSIENSYIITYNVRDTAGNHATEATRKVQIVSTLSIRDDHISITQMLYPNPALEWIKIEKLLTPNEYTIYNSLGKVIGNGKTEKNIYVGNLIKGMYFLKLKNGNTFQFIKK